MKKGDGTTYLKDSGDGKKVIIVRDGDGKILTENINPPMVSAESLSKKPTARFRK